MLDDYTRHQQKIIKNYYHNLDQLSLQKLSEYVTELYLAEGTKRQNLWKSIVSTLKKLELPQSRIDHLVEKDDPKLLANLVKELHNTK